MRKIRKGDQVIAIAGKDKGKTGVVLRVVPRKIKKGKKVFTHKGGEMGFRIVVEGLNMIKKHVRPDPNRGIEGGIVEREAALHCSNIAIYNPQTNKADRVGIKTLEDGQKVRFYKSTGDEIDVE